MNRMLGIIPARGNSKRLPNKNIKPLQGVPLIEYTIQAAKRSRSLTRLMVSTDNEDIAKTSQKAGAEVPFLRPSELAEDDSDVLDTCLQVLDEYRKRENYVPDVVVMLQPTSPLRHEVHIDEAITLFQHKQADSVLSVCQPEYPPDSLVSVEQGGTLRPSLTPSMSNSSGINTDPTSNIYRVNGAIYTVRTSFLQRQKSFYGNKTYPYLMSQTESVDIDTDLDFQLASLLMRKRHKLSKK